MVYSSSVCRSIPHLRGTHSPVISPERWVRASSVQTSRQRSKAAIILRGCQVQAATSGSDVSLDGR